MSTANVFGFPNAKAHSPRNAFDMSHDTLFNSPAGMLLPCYVEDVKAGDKLKLSCKNFTRTRAVNTSAYMAFNEKVDFFFVPYRLIWSAYNQWRLGNTQPRSSTNLQQLGYMEMLPCMPWTDLSVFFTSLKTHLSAAKPSVPGGSFSTPYFAFTLRMLDLLGYGLPFKENITGSRDGDGFLDSCIAHFNTMASNFFFNYFRLAAYQCIYMYSYRNEDYEKLDPSYYNIDSLFITKDSYPQSMFFPPDPETLDENYSVNQSTPYTIFHGLDQQSSVNNNRMTLVKLFTPRFKNWRKDLFTSLKPIAGIITGSQVLDNFESDSTVVNPVEWNGSVTGSGIETFPKSNVGYTVGNNTLIPGITSTPITMDDVRKLSALDKFTRLAMYSDKNYSSLYEALFGVKVDEPDVPRYLGTFSSEIKISEVVGTADGSSGDSTSVLGQIAGKGIGSSQSRVFDAEFKEDGIVMGIHYIMPYNYYNSYRYNPFCVKSSKFDYYYPSFDGLGLSPVFYGERTFDTTGTGFTPTPTTIIGYNTRYHEYKQRTSEIHGSFASGQPDSHWTLAINNSYTSNASSLFKISPSCTDTIFGVNWNGAPSTDPFMCFYSFNATKVSNMEAIGVPNT